MAEQLGLDILPVMIDGFGKVLPKKSWHLHPGHMSVEVMQRQPMEGGYRAMAKKMHKMYKERKGCSWTSQAAKPSEQSAISKYEMRYHW